MKKHYLSKGAGTTLLGAKDEGYSVYKNPDAELREKIKNFKPDQTKVKMGWPEKTWDIIEWEDKEVKCQSGRNTSYFKVKEVKEALAEQAEIKRNEKFPAYKHFKDAFGIISRLNKSEYSWNMEIIDLVGNIKIMGNFNPMNVEHYNHSYSGELKLGSTPSSDLSLKLSKGCNMMCLYFNENGDYMNRDYNENLNTFKCEEMSMKVLLDEFKKRIVKLGEIGYSRGNYYIGNKKYQPFVNREDHELLNRIEFGLAGDPVKSTPKKLEYKTGEEVWAEIEKFIPEDMYKIFNLKETKNAVEA